MKHFVLSLVAIAALCMPAAAQNKVKNVYTSHAPLSIEQLQSSEQTVVLNRYLFAGYNTICLPMSVTNEQLQAQAQGIRLERLAAIAEEGSTLNLYFVDCTQEGIEAGKPYLIFIPIALNLRLAAQGASDRLETTRLTTAAGNTVSFGSNWDIVREDGLYGIPAKQDVTLLESILIRTDGEKAFLPTRCGFNWEQQADNATDLCIRHIQSLDQVSAINAVETTKAESAIYDLNGRRLATAQRGIIIQNGKKVLK